MLQDALSRFYCCTADGALGRPDGTHGDPNHTDGVPTDKRHIEWANKNISDGASLMEMVKKIKPTILLGYFSFF